MRILGIFNQVTSWMAAQNERRKAEMEAKGICPDCYGKGYNIYALNEFTYSNLYDCPGCNGSGQYSDWFDNNQSL